MEMSEADNEAIEDAGGLKDIVERYSTPPLSPDDVFAGALARHALRLTRERDEARAEKRLALQHYEVACERIDALRAEVERLRKAAKAYLHAGGDVYEAAWPDGDLSRLDLAPGDTAEALERRYIDAEGTLSRALTEADRA